MDFQGIWGKAGWMTIGDEAGFVTWVINGTGVASVKGQVITNSSAANNKYVAQTNEFDAIGIVAIAGIADGLGVPIWKNGSRCQVLFEAAKTPTRAYVAICAATDGRADNVNTFPGNPGDTSHFKEIGHTCETAAAGGLALVDLHFN